MPIVPVRASAGISHNIARVCQTVSNERASNNTCAPLRGLTAFGVTALLSSGWCIEDSATHDDGPTSLACPAARIRARNGRAWPSSASASTDAASTAPMTNCQRLLSERPLLWARTSLASTSPSAVRCRSGMIHVNASPAGVGANRLWDDCSRGGGTGAPRRPARATGSAVCRRRIAIPGQARP